MTEIGGWAWPLNARKAHYFVEGRSLCGRWAFFGKTSTSVNRSPDDCKACHRVMEEQGADLQEWLDA